MKELIKNIILLLKIFTPAISCIIVIIFFDITFMNYLYLVLLFFGIIIILPNYNKVKYNYYLSFIFSMFLSYLTFLLSIGIYFSIAYILMQIIDLDNLEGVLVFNVPLKYILLLLPIAIISPILMFRSYRILFEINNNKYFKIIRFIAIILLIIYGLISKKFEKDYVIVWQIIMALSLQLILYKDEIIALFNKSPVPNNLYS